MKLRRLILEDINSVSAIAKESMPYPWDDSVFRDCFKPNYFSWVVVEGDQLVGFIIVFLRSDESELMNIAVKPDFQRKGCARFLLEHAIAFLKAKGVKRLFLEVRRSNEPAICFYKKMGAEQISIRKGYYAAGGISREDALIFSFAWSSLKAS